MQNEQRDLQDRTKRFAQKRLLNLKLVRLAAYSLLPSSLYLLCRASRALHSSFCILTSYFTLVILRQMTSSLFVFRQLPLRSTATLAALPAISLIPFAPFADLRTILRLTGFFPHDVFVVSSVDQRINFPGVTTTKQNSAFDAFAEKKF